MALVSSISVLTGAAGRRVASSELALVARALGSSSRGFSLSPLAEAEFSSSWPRHSSPTPGALPAGSSPWGAAPAARRDDEDGLPDPQPPAAGTPSLPPRSSDFAVPRDQDRGWAQAPGFCAARGKSSWSSGGLSQQHLLPMSAQQGLLAAPHTGPVSPPLDSELGSLPTAARVILHLGVRRRGHGARALGHGSFQLLGLGGGTDQGALFPVQHGAVLLRGTRFLSSSPAPEPARASATTAGAAHPGSSKGAPVSTAAVTEELAEECDEAVEDLGEVKARVKAAREAVRKGKGVLRATWLLLGAVAGNAWRAVASLRVVFTWTRKDWADTFAGWGRAVRHAAHHYWVGTKLLWADIRISSRLLLKTAKGDSLTRRERQQLMRTSADIFRLVPFAVFIIVPFMEFLLPLALRLFPNMLPSTYQDQKQEEVKLKRLLQARLEMARFLQDTVHEMAREVKGRREGEVRKTAEELTRFMTKVRTGGRVSNSEIMGFASLFNDELTLDNMTRPRLVSMCKYMGLQTFGTDSYLRYILRARLAWIKEDDKMIQAEGVESLSEAELRAACRERGMLGLRDVPSMRHQLQDWLDLSLSRSVPSSLLILSRSFLLAGKVKPEEAVQATLSSLPEQVVASVGASVPAGNETSERQRKLEKLQEEEKLIKEEAAAAARLKAEEAESRRDRALEEMKEAGGVPAPPGREAPVPGLAGARAGAGAEERQQMAQDLSRESRDKLCDLSAALAVLASSSAVSKERMDFLRLVNREIEMYNTMVEKTGSEGEEEAKAKYAAAREASEKEASEEDKSGEEVSEALINKVDSMLHQLEKELDRVDAKIGSKLRILDTDYDGKVTAEEVAAAAAMLRDSLGHGQIPELIANLAKDKDGKILVEDIVRLGTVDTKEAQTAQSVGVTAQT